MGRRKRAPSRIASQLQALQNVGNTTKVIKEETKVKTEAARLARRELRIEARKKQIEENALQLVDLRKKPPKPKLMCDPRLAIATMTIQAPQYLTETKIDDQGVTTRKIVIGHDGQPLLAHPVATAEVSKPAELPEPARPKTRVEEMREHYLQHHNGTAPAATGSWCNPGGVVSRNIATEGGPDFRTSRLRLRDF